MHGVCLKVIIQNSDFSVGSILPAKIDALLGVMVKMLSKYFGPNAVTYATMKSSVEPTNVRNMKTGFFKSVHVARGNSLRL